MSQIIKNVRNILSKRKLSLCSTRYSKDVKSHNHKYSDTINLPKTTFPLRFSGRERTEADRNIQQNCGFNELYTWQRENLNGPDFILHDGPPYANGEPHMGHAINKILKDITLRYRVRQGQRVHYIPGWDCHGLPIELKALGKDISDGKLAPVEIRKRAREFATNTASTQQEAFKSWGVMADWKESGTYMTMDKEYIQHQLRSFWELYEKGLIYRELKPVHWSPSSKTALAESELEYDNNFRSPSLTLQINLQNVPIPVKRYMGSKIEFVHALIWTTTPWTLPSNQAVCYNPKAFYSLVEIEGQGGLYIVASGIIEDLQKMINRNVQEVLRMTGNDLQNTTYSSLVDGHPMNFYPSDHVSTSKGTGFVHIAPAHGPEDYLIGKKYNLPLTCLVDENGNYTSEAPDFLQGLNVFTTGTAEVLKALKDYTIHLDKLVHSYPLDWRTKEPVILRASYQWFIDTDKLKNSAISQLEEVKVYPNHSSLSNTRGLVGQLERRPYWCISRQRAWGVPIPVLYNKYNNSPIVHLSIIESLCDAVERDGGVDSWWNKPVSEIISESVLKELDLKLDDVVKGNDILDIWLDSGVSWLGVLGREKIADLYLEGVDQFNGWFQSSLMTSVALRGKAPYKNVFVHGFAVDKNGLKMSKSLGNVIHPMQITDGEQNTKALGVDVLRWWVASHAPQHPTINVSTHILKNSADTVHRLRLVLRFLLGSTHNITYIPKTTDPIPKNIGVLDRYMLHTFAKFDAQITEYYNTYQYHLLGPTISGLVTNPLSGLYIHVVKDRLYCGSDADRVNILMVLSSALAILCRVTWPIVPHLIEEAWSHFHGNKDKTPFYKSEVGIPLWWNSPTVTEPLDLTLQVRREINKQVPKQSTWPFEGVITGPAEQIRLLQMLQPEEFSNTSELCDILQLSSVKLIENNKGNSFNVDLVKRDRELCARCRRHAVAKSVDLCARCSKILGI